MCFLCTCGTVSYTHLGIGEQFAKRLAKEGYDLILVARRRERLTALSDKLKATHKELKCDIFTADLLQLDE